MKKLRDLIEKFDNGEITVIEYKCELVGHGYNEADSERISIWYEKKS